MDQQFQDINSITLKPSSDRILNRSLNPLVIFCLFKAQILPIKLIPSSISTRLTPVAQTNQ